MEKGSLPLETAFEPAEEAGQPFQQSMPTSQNKAKGQNITFANSEKTDSQTSSIYKDILSQPALDLSHKQRLLWLQKRRNMGLWVQCDECDSWRYLPNILDSYELPAKWYCRLNPDTTLAFCSAPEVPIRIRDEEDLIHSEYAAGSIVLARLPGWPWWPAMVDDCPDTEQYYWLDGFSDIPTHYNVVFFDSVEVTRAWLTPALLKPFSSNKDLLVKSMRRKAYRKRLDVAILEANNAEKLTLLARLTKHSFIARYKGTIASPKKITKNDVKKYQNTFKRKFNIDLPNDSSDSDNEISKTQTKGKRRKNISTVGKKKLNNNTNEGKVRNHKNIQNSVKASLSVQVDTNFNLARSATNVTSTTHEDVEKIQEVIAETPQRTLSASSNDFDF